VADRQAVPVWATLACFLGMTHVVFYVPRALVLVMLLQYTVVCCGGEGLASWRQRHIRPSDVLLLGSQLQLCAADHGASYALEVSSLSMFLWLPCLQALTTRNNQC
jgi:hypothetical protein